MRSVSFSIAHVTLICLAPAVHGRVRGEPSALRTGASLASCACRSCKILHRAMLCPSACSVVGMVRFLTFPFLGPTPTDRSTRSLTHRTHAQRTALKPSATLTIEPVARVDSVSTWRGRTAHAGLRDGRTIDLHVSEQTRAPQCTAHARRNTHTNTDAPAGLSHSPLGARPHTSRTGCLQSAWGPGERPSMRTNRLEPDSLTIVLCAPLISI